ncbi:hypothetical protein DH2020_014607 [Rehmannia glutinosa]|uniref:Uncharacterized protein n=1 Tax=Rehmannia glutinosa TaxID=99300 RepID=A0ABR0WX00_REHGL
MASSDDEAEMVPENVSDHDFAFGDKEPVSFANLPVEWNKGDPHGGKLEEIFLSGKTDNGLRQIYMQVVAWKFDLPCEKPDISVLSQKGHWIKLLKPRKSFEYMIRTIQITVHFLHFAKWNPQRSEKALWDYLNKSFRLIWNLLRYLVSLFTLLKHLSQVHSSSPLGLIFRSESIMLLMHLLISMRLEPINRRLILLIVYFVMDDYSEHIVNHDVKPPFIVDDVDENDNQEELDKSDENGDDESDEDDCFDCLRQFDSLAHHWSVVTNEDVVDADIPVVEEELVPLGHELEGENQQEHMVFSRNRVMCWWGLKWGRRKRSRATYGSYDEGDDEGKTPITSVVEFVTIIALMTRLARLSRLNMSATLEDQGRRVNCSKRNVNIRRYFGSDAQQGRREFDEEQVTTLKEDQPLRLGSEIRFIILSPEPKLICDGKCMRSFHATLEDGDESQCVSLGFTDEELEAIKDVPFIVRIVSISCTSALLVGNWDLLMSHLVPRFSKFKKRIVFCCVNGACGFFYHPDCVAKLLHPGDDAAAEEHRKRIADGEKFACPAHRCHVCKELEVRSKKEFQFAVCRRCPRAYHRKCLPREIALDKEVDIARGIVQRAWEDLIPNRLLIYCLEHEIDPNIFTPVRDHIKFPGPRRERKTKLPLEDSKKKYRLREGGLALKDKAGKIISAKPRKGVDKVFTSSKQGDLSRRRVEELPAAGGSSKMQKATNRNSFGKLKDDEREMSLGNKLYTTFYAMDSEPVKSSEGGSVYGEHERTQKVKPTAKRIDNSVTLDADTRKRIFKLMKDASSALTLDQVKERHKCPSTHTQYSKFYVDNVTLGKVEGSVQAVRAALKKLEGGGSIQDAKMVCGNDLLGQVLRWKDKMKVYLAPFLYGMRYTSFGRHFTKMDKLKEIVDMLHWYVQDGDLLVDFCCGSNDFSCLMKKKLDEMGKKCSFKNYDILQAKNDFNFERRDWMKVRSDELQVDGSQLIMGLNPPFGVNAALANKFIDKALVFKPKLLILIVPRETQRLDEKESPYDLIWEDDQMFAGKSFYLPGSVDVNDKQIEDWNMKPPVLYLWSRPSSTSKHKAIAEQHGHYLSGAQKNVKLEENHNEIHAPSSSQECRDLEKKIFVNKGEDPVKPEKQEQEEKVTPSNQEDLPRHSKCTGEVKNHTPGKNLTEENSKKSGGKRKRGKRSNSASAEDKSANKRSTSRHPSPNVAARRSSETHSPKRLENPLQVHSGRHDYQQFNQTNFSTYNNQPYAQAAYNDNQAVDDVVRMYTTLNEEGPYLERNILPGVKEASLLRPYAGPGFPSPFGQLNPNPGYGEMNTSAMQRYAPRLDELNHGRMSNMVPGPPLHDASGIYHPHGPRPATSQVNSLGFAPGPYRPYSHQSSSGWLNE